MSNPIGGGNFFEGFLGDLLKMISTDQPVNWELTKQFAQGVAGEGQPETNVDPLERIRLEELARVADLHVGSATGMTTSATGKAVSVLAVTRAEWASRTLDAWKPLMESLAVALAPGSGVEAEAEIDPPDLLPVEPTGDL
ncbi:MAG: zinc-dependent metalloprotease, partial [Mycobacterium sp.]